MAEYKNALAHWKAISYFGLYSAVGHDEVIACGNYVLAKCEQGIGKAAELLGPSLMCSQTVYTDAQNLSVRRLKARIIALKGGDLGLSAAGKVKHIEG